MVALEAVKVHLVLNAAFGSRHSLPLFMEAGDRTENLIHAGLPVVGIGMILADDSMLPPDRIKRFLAEGKLDEYRFLPCGPP